MTNIPDPRFRVPRVWSNKELRKVAHLFSGDIANVSGGDDVDKEGLHYREYFTSARSYMVTNYGGASFRGFQNRPGEIMLDLTQPLPEDLRGKFDVVLNHTTLEHIFDVFMAFHNICEMTRDIAIVVVPFSQVQHETGAFRDFWRFTPTCLRELFFREGLKVVYESCNEYPNESLYLFMVASRSPSNWQGKILATPELKEAGKFIGSQQSMEQIFKLPIVKETSCLKLIKLTATEIFSRFKNGI